MMLICLLLVCVVNLYVDYRLWQAVQALDHRITHDATAHRTFRDDGRRALQNRMDARFGIRK